MSTRTELREAFADLSESAPTVDPRALLERLGATHAPTHRARRRWAPVALASAAVIVLALVTSLATARPWRHTTYSAPAAPSPAAADSPWLYGPDSLPGYQPTIMLMDAGGAQEFSYAEGAAPLFSPGDPTASYGSRGSAALTVALPDAKQRAMIDALPQAAVAGTAGRAGTVNDDVRCPGSSLVLCYKPVAAWPVGDGRWAIFTATDASMNPLALDRTLVLANSLRPQTQNRVSAVKIGYLPPAMRIRSLVDDYADSALEYGSRGYRMLAFSVGGSDKSAEVNVTIVHDPIRPLSSMTAASLSADIHLGPWTKTTVRGHLAWTSPTDILIQWGDLLVSVNNGKSIPGGADSLPATSQDELLKVADSLTVAANDDFGTGWSLSQAIPPGAGW